MQRFFGIAQDVSGNVIPSCSVRVRFAGTGTNATLYSDNSYTPLANPFTSETDGAYQFYARNGRFDIVLTKTGYTFDDDDTADVLLEDPSSVITPALITGSQNDYTPTNGLNARIWRLSTNGNYNISGIAAGLAGQWLTVINTTGFNLTLLNLSGLSLAANQIITGTGGNVILSNASNSSNATMFYDSTTQAWRITDVQT